MGHWRIRIGLKSQKGMCFFFVLAGYGTWDMSVFFRLFFWGLPTWPIFYFGGLPRKLTPAHQCFLHRCPAWFFRRKSIVFGDFLLQFRRLSGQHLHWTVDSNTARRSTNQKHSNDLCSVCFLKNGRGVLLNPMLNPFLQIPGSWFFWWCFVFESSQFQCLIVLKTPIH